MPITANIKVLNLYDPEMVLSFNAYKYKSKEEIGINLMIFKITTLKDSSDEIDATSFKLNSTCLLCSQSTHPMLNTAKIRSEIELSRILNVNFCKL